MVEFISEVLIEYPPCNLIRNDPSSAADAVLVSITADVTVDNISFLNIFDYIIIDLKHKKKYHIYNPKTNNYGLEMYTCTNYYSMHVFLFFLKINILNFS